MWGKDKFISLAEKYENFDTMTTTMLNEFVEKIHVYERDRKGSIETTQRVEISFNFVGRYVPPHFGEVNLSPEELEELLKKRNARIVFTKTTLNARQAERKSCMRTKSRHRKRQKWMQKRTPYEPRT